MDLLLLVGPYVLMAAAVLQATAFGARYGARTTMAVIFPFQIIGRHLIQLAHPKVGLERLQGGLGPSLLTMVMVYAFAIPYLIVSRLLWRRRAGLGGLPGSVADRRDGWIAFVVAVVASVALHPIYEPVVAGIPADQALRVATWLAPALVIVGLLVFRLPPEERAPDPAPADATNGVLRVVTVWAVMLVLDLDFLVRDGSADAFLSQLAYVLHSFPRATTELVVATHLTAGSRAGRQVLAGLPWGLVGISVWCLGLAWLPGLVGPVAGVVLAAALFLAWWIGFVAWWVRHGPVRRPADPGDRAT